MIYIETGSTDVYYNFGLEYYFSVEKRLSDTVFLFWRTTPTLMVGKYQNVLEEINKPYADEHGIHIVRRMSGGGTIYTDLGGWQFTFIQHKEAGEIEFHQYIAPVIDALREMGVHAEFNGRNDLTIDGKKFSGNAQYRLGDCVVHHGSLLFDTNIRQMVESTTVDSYKILSKSIKSVRDRVTNIAEHLPAPMDADTFKECMVRHIMGSSGAVYEITPGDDDPENLRIKRIDSDLETILEKYTHVDKVHLINCGGDDLIAAAREQWNDGSNTLCIAPGKIVVYQRNDVTNPILRDAGITVLEMPSAELSRGRGGPRCMSMPLERISL